VRRPGLAPEARRLLEGAARCYLHAGDTEGARRCFEQLGDLAEAARLYEAAGLPRDAADFYEQAGYNPEAARCYRAAGDAAGEARCLALAGEPLRAGWILAHDLGRAAEARALCANAGLGLDADGIAARLVLARCSAALGERAPAARALHQALPALRRIPAGPLRRRLSGWALALAETLHRPDLGAVVITTLEGGAGAGEIWDAWARRTFGEPVAPPIQLEREATAGDQETPGP
jgi:tetratricopeptide (TPR) repeat protein